MNSVLFLCTGNYYRSRMAEVLFNFWAQNYDLGWKAESAGLREEMSASPNEGPISEHAVRILKQSGYPIEFLNRDPRSISEDDLEIHDLVICLHRPEHEPMIEKRFPAFSGEILYWEIPDIQYLKAEKAFEQIRMEVQQLISILGSSQKYLITAD